MESRLFQFLERTEAEMTSDSLSAFMAGECEYYTAPDQVKLAASSGHLIAVHKAVRELAERAKKRQLGHLPAGWVNPADSWVTFHQMNNARLKIMTTQQLPQGAFSSVPCQCCSQASSTAEELLESPA